MEAAKNFVAGTNFDVPDEPDAPTPLPNCPSPSVQSSTPPSPFSKTPVSLPLPLSPLSPRKSLQLPHPPAIHPSPSHSNNKRRARSYFSSIVKNLVPSAQSVSASLNQLSSPLSASHDHIPISASPRIPPSVALADLVRQIQKQHADRVSVSNKDKEPVIPQLENEYKEMRKVVESKQDDDGHNSGATRGQEEQEQEQEQERKEDDKQQNDSIGGTKSDHYDSNDDDEFEVDGDDNSFFIFSKTGFVRRFLARYLYSFWADSFFFLCICMDVIVQALQNPVHDDPAAVSGLDLAILFVYSIEMIVRSISLGLIIHRDSFLRASPWNVLDFGITICAWLAYIPIQGGDSMRFVFIRLISKASRLLRFFRFSWSTRAILSSLRTSSYQVINVLGLFIFFFIVWGIVGISNFGGSLSRRCAIVGSDGSISLALPETWCKPSGAGFGWQCSGTQQCISYQSPGNGWISFDTMGTSFVTLYIITTQDNWTKYMYALMDSEYGWSFLFFILLELLIASFVVSLFLAVISSTFNAVRQGQRSAFSDPFSSSSFLSSFSFNFCSRPAMPPSSPSASSMSDSSLSLANPSLPSSDPSSPSASSAVPSPFSVPPANNVPMFPPTPSHHKDQMTSFTALISSAPMTPKSYLRNTKSEEQKAKLRASAEASLANTSKWTPIKDWLINSFITFGLFSQKIIFHPHCGRVFEVLALMNAAFISAESYEYKDSIFFFTIEVIFTAIFAFEIVAYIMAFGFRQYVSQGIHRIRIGIAILTVIALPLWTTVPVLKLIRCFRALRCFRLYAPVRELIDVALGNLESVTNVLQLLAVCWVASAVLGVQLFGGRTAAGIAPLRINFDTFPNAIVAIFQILTGDNWSDLWVAALTLDEPFYAVVYFVVTYIIFVYILLNLVVSAILENFALREEFICEKQQEEFIQAEVVREFAKMKSANQKIHQFLRKVDKRKRLSAKLDMDKIRQLRLQQDTEDAKETLAKLASDHKLAEQRKASRLSLQPGNGSNSPQPKEEQEQDQAAPPAEIVILRDDADGSAVAVPKADQAILDRIISQDQRSMSRSFQSFIKQKESRKPLSHIMDPPAPVDLLSPSSSTTPSPAASSFSSAEDKSSNGEENNNSNSSAVFVLDRADSFLRKPSFIGRPYSASKRRTSLAPPPPSSNSDSVSSSYVSVFRPSHGGMKHTHSATNVFSSSNPSAASKAADYSLAAFAGGQWKRSPSVNSMKQMRPQTAGSSPSIADVSVRARSLFSKQFNNSSPEKSLSDEKKNAVDAPSASSPLTVVSSDQSQPRQPDPQPLRSIPSALRPASAPPPSSRVSFSAMVSSTMVEKRQTQLQRDSSLSSSFSRSNSEVRISAISIASARASSLASIVVHPSSSPSQEASREQARKEEEELYKDDGFIKDVNDEEMQVEEVAVPYLADSSIIAQIMKKRQEHFKQKQEQEISLKKFFNKVLSQLRSSPANAQKARSFFASSRPSSLAVGREDEGAAEEERHHRCAKPQQEVLQDNNTEEDEDEESIPQPPKKAKPDHVQSLFNSTEYGIIPLIQSISDGISHLKSKLAPSVRHRLEHYSCLLWPIDHRVRKTAIRIESSHFFRVMTFLSIVLSCILAALDSPINSPSSALYQITKLADTIFVGMFAAEAAVKIIARGLVFTRPASYLSDSWHVFDMSILIALAVSLATGGPGFSRSFRSLRVLGAMRVIPRFQTLKQIITSFLQSLVSLLRVSILLYGVALVFANFGQTMLMGKMAFCNDSSVTYRSECVDTFETNDGVTIPRVWKNNAFNFDTHFGALNALQVIASCDGWLDIATRAVDYAGSPDLNSQTNASWYFYAFFFVFILVFTMFFLQLFVAVIVNSLRETKGASLLTEKQKIWHNIKSMIVSVAAPQKRYRPANATRLTNFLFEYFDGLDSRNTRVKRFYRLVSFVLLANAIVLCIEHYKQPEAVSNFILYSDVFFVAFYIFEMWLKLIVLRPSVMLKSKLHRFDVVICIGSLISLIMELSGSLLPGYFKGIRPARYFRVLRLFRLLQSELFIGLAIVIKTFILSLPSILNVCIVLCFVYFTFAVAGTALCGNVRFQQELNRHANFQTFTSSFLTLVRISTGESWATLMTECAVEPPYCTEPYCGSSWMSPMYFATFRILGAQVMIAFLTAVLLDNMSWLSARDSSLMASSVLEQYQSVWRKYDIHYKEYIPVHELKSFLRALGRPLGISPLLPSSSQHSSRPASAFGSFSMRRSASSGALAVLTSLSQEKKKSGASKRESEVTREEEEAKAGAEERAKDDRQFYFLVRNEVQQHLVKMKYRMKVPVRANAKANNGSFSSPSAPSFSSSFSLDVGNSISSPVAPSLASAASSSFSAPASFVDPSAGNIGISLTSSIVNNTHRAPQGLAAATAAAVEKEERASVRASSLAAIAATLEGKHSNSNNRSSNNMFVEIEKDTLCIGFAQLLTILVVARAGVESLSLEERKKRSRELEAVMLDVAASKIGAIVRGKITRKRLREQLLNKEQEERAQRELQQQQEQQQHLSSTEEARPSSNASVDEKEGKGIEQDVREDAELAPMDDIVEASSPGADAVGSEPANHPTPQ